MPLLFGALGAVAGITSAFWAVAVALAFGSRVATRASPMMIADFDASR